MERQVYLLYAETQVHAGSGYEIGVIDLPIQRERTTGFPIIQGIKGALRAFFRSSKSNEELDIFGSEVSPVGKETTPSKVAFSEAKILFFPVRNPDKLFVWVTCPLALSRFLNVAGENEALEEFVNLQLEDQEAFTFESVDEVWLEEVCLKVKKDVSMKSLHRVISKVSKCAPIQSLQEKMEKDLVLVSDEMFSDIVETMTEIIPRIRINRETKTVEERALWYEEYLPQDTVMYFVARLTAYGCDSLLKTLKQKIDGQLINFGGKETVGKGMMWVKCFGGDESENPGS